MRLKNSKANYYENIKFGKGLDELIKIIHNINFCHNREWNMEFKEIHDQKKIHDFYTLYFITAL